MKKLLMIEDNVEFSEIIAMALKGRVTVLVKNNTHNLAEVLEQFNPDVLLIDNHIGQKNATEIIAEIRCAGAHASIPVILISAHSNVENIAKEIMASAWLLKPFKLTDLYSTIEKVLTMVA